MANEQEAAAGLYSLLKATPEEGQQLRPDPPRSVSSSSTALNQTQTQSQSQSQSQTPNGGGADQFTEADTSAESMRKLTEMLLQKRPVVDALKNQGYGIVTPHQHDILSGRGNGANQHPGNIFFRNLIHKYKHHYIHTGPSEKKLITKRIVEEVQQRDPPGRFLKQNHETELWDCLDIDKVLKKTGQALREKAPELKKRAREEFKVRVTTSAESYFQNSRPGVTSHKRPAKSLSPSEFDSVAMRGYENDIPMTTSSHSMAFPMAGNLDALAYQAIPLASPSKGINDSFNMAHLAAVTNQVDPINRKKAEQLIVKAVNSTTTLTEVYEFIRTSPNCLNTTKTKVVRSRYPLPIRRTSHKAQRKGGETLSVQPSAISAHPHDVLFRDGTVVTAHPGSVFFCEQVNILLPQYKGSIVHEKRIEQKVIAAIGARWPPGRFLCAADGTCTSWHVLTFDQALQATSTHLRHACFESQRVVIPNPRDVLVIRGNSQHQGNIYFRTLIEKYSPAYENVMSNNVRKHIAKQIMEEVDRVGGRFLKFNSQNNYWEPLELDTVMTKTIHGMRDYQKKKEQQQKVIKPTGLIIPVLNCIKESVEDKGKNSDPPGVFYNYYSKADNSDTDTLAIDMTGKDPPGQVANVIPELDVKNEEVQQQQQEQQVQVQVQRPQEVQVQVEQQVQQHVQQRLQQQIQVHQQLQQEQLQPALIRRPDSPGDQNQNSSHYQQTANHLVSGGMGQPPPPPMGYYSSPVVPAKEVAPPSTSLVPVTVPTTAHIVSDPPASDSRKRSHDDKMTDLRPTEKRVKLEP